MGTGSPHRDQETFFESAGPYVFSSIVHDYFVKLAIEHARAAGQKQIPTLEPATLSGFPKGTKPWGSTAGPSTTAKST